MPRTISPQKAAEKFSRAASQRTQDYADGISNPRRPWLEATVAASERQKQAVIAAANKDLFKKGVEKAGNNKWQKNARTKGPNRFAEGVSAAQDDYAKAVQPFFQAIENTSLPPRYGRGDPRNWERSKAIGMALNKVRTGG